MIIADLIKLLGLAEIVACAAGSAAIVCRIVLNCHRRFGNGGVAGLMLLSWILRRRLFQTSSELIVRFLQWHLNTIWSLISLRLFAVELSSLANDGQPVLNFVSATRTRYGPRSAELVTVLEPSKTHELRDRLRGPLREMPMTMSFGEWGLEETPLHLLDPPPPSVLLRPSSSLFLSSYCAPALSALSVPLMQKSLAPFPSLQPLSTVFSGPCQSSVSFPGSPSPSCSSVSASPLLSPTSTSSSSSCDSSVSSADDSCSLASALSSPDPSTKSLQLPASSSCDSSCSPNFTTPLSPSCVSSVGSSSSSPPLATSIPAPFAPSVSRPLASSSQPFKEDPSLPPVLYVHGGGFVAANAAVLMQSVTPLCRKGFTVYCIDYPLAPLHRFPIPVISILRAMFWMRHYRGVDRIVLYGDSAGAALATMAAAFACNPALLNALLAEVRRAGPSEDILDSAQWGDWRSLPVVERVLSVYGLLDRFSWRGSDLTTISKLENALAREGIKFCFDAFVNDRHDYFNGRCCFASMLEDEGNGVVSKYPPLFLLCGTRDPLLLSNRRVHAMFKTAGFRCILKEYDARHAFLGFPPRWLSPRLQAIAAEAQKDVTQFLITGQVD